jgi:hypothetical protein
MALSKVTGLLAVGFMLTAAATAAYADLCKNVTFTFTNRHPLERTIRVDKVMYWDLSDTKWRTEDIVPNRECTFNAKCTTSPEDLEHVENEVIQKVRFIYRELVGGKWSSDITSREKEPLDQTTECHEGRNYHPAPDGFIIP